MAMQALVMGFGGTGAHILTALKELTVLKAGRVPDSIKFLLFDTIADWEPGKAVQTVGGGAEEKLAQGRERATSLDPASEYFFLSDHDPDLRVHVNTFLSRAGNPEKYPHLKDWLHAPWLTQHIGQAHLGIVQGAAQQRQIGRFAMFQNADRILSRIGSLMKGLAKEAKGAGVNVWIIGSVAGGTGAGCLLDAAYLTHLAGRDVERKVNGIIVLPNVYEGVTGISQGRAYSLLREIDRVQGKGSAGIPVLDRYLMDGGVISSHVSYDSLMQSVAHVENKLFDDLFYLGSDCPSDQQRKKFFTSAANAIDPYLDESSGPKLLEAAVNDTAAAASFGASRVYLPVETFAEIFAWEEVAEYLKAAAAPNQVEEENRVDGLVFGDEGDRKRNAKSRVENLLALFGALLQREGKTDNEAYAKRTLDAEQIVTKWYQFAGLAIAGERLTDVEAQVVRLAYLNPYLSLTEFDPGKVPLKDKETKTYKESKETKGVKESQEESRDRFASKLEEITDRYTSASAGERSFERGRKVVFEKVSTRLKNAVDRAIIEELERATTFGVDPANPKEGTALTRLHEEITHILEDGKGPMSQIDKIVGDFIRGMEQEKATRDQQTVEALRTLRSSQKTGMFGFGSWVDVFQHNARSECEEYIRWYQKNRLLQDMQQIVRSVRRRFEDWYRTIGGMLGSLVINEGDESKASSLFLVKEFRIKKLNDRMYRAARNPSAIISFKPDPDPGMMGYRKHLKESIGKPSAELLSGSQWEASVAQDGSPELKLMVTSDDPITFSKGTIRNLHQALHNYFLKKIITGLETKDIFDYLLYVQRNNDIDPGRIARALSDAAEPLINAGRAPEEWQLIYSSPSGEEKRNLAGAIQGGLLQLKREAKDPETSHSDKNSITLIKVKKPSLDQIDDIRISRQDYLRLMVEPLNGSKKHDDEVYRAQVFHPFRHELEAWYIERYTFRKQNDTPVDIPIAPRVVRLLEDPAMMHMFAHCLAVGAVKRVMDKGWIWYPKPANQTEEVFLSDEKSDVIAAAIIFVLQRKEGRRFGARPITFAEAKQSFDAMLGVKGITRREALAGFVKNDLENFLNENSPRLSDPQEQSSLRHSLKMIFEFYCDPETRTDLQERMDLP
jgi:hypothetical protein